MLSLPCIILIVSDDESALSVDYGASDSLLLLLSEAIGRQIEKFEFCLSGDKCDERVHAAISATKPFSFSSNREAVQGIDTVVSDGLRELVTICVIAE